MKIKDIVLGLILVLIIYLVYTWFFHDSTKSYLTDGVIDAKKPEPDTIKESNFPPGVTNDFAYSVWIYVTSWQYRSGEKKVILSRGDDTDDSKIELVLDDYLNNVNINLGTFKGGSSGSSQASCSIKNIPLQKWVNIIFTLNNRALDLYLDGKLVRTCLLDGISKFNATSSGDLKLCPSDKNGSGAGFDGNMSGLLYFSRAINPREAYAIYRDGPGGTDWLTNLINKYRLKIAFMSHDKEINSFEI